MTEHAERYYTPTRLTWLIRKWPEVLAAAETPGSARQLMDPFRVGSTPSNPKSARQRGSHHDCMGWALVVADVEIAWGQLPLNSLGWRTVQARMQGHTLGRFAEAHRMTLTHQEVQTAFKTAVERMATTLGWVPVETEDEG